ncbi:hypothetical protein C8D87_104405 [Lentzea atacamensis]|uniref:Uncharacterized protein n=1 Tax=Lentzea atacamensis TaxID=531938 RepID=A0ABX9E831_9PSEU|nr:hypothetical protein C8D87_104405 [Lentzea atacamensis]
MRTDSSNESAFAEFTSTKADSLLHAAWLLTGRRRSALWEYRSHAAPGEPEKGMSSAGDGADGRS